MTEVLMQPFTGEGSIWNAMIARIPTTHLLQTWEWAQVKAAYGWQPIPFIWKSQTSDNRTNASATDHESEVPLAAAMVLKKQVMPLGGSGNFCILYLPKGPIVEWGNKQLRDQVFDDLQTLARRERAIFIKFDPDVVIGRGIPGEATAQEDLLGTTIAAELRQRGWLVSDGQIQFRNTVLIDLSATEDEMLRRMKQKARYNIRLAEKKGVTVRAGTLAELPVMYQMYAETSKRNGFVIRNEGYYKTVWQAFLVPTTDRDRPAAESWIAEVDGQRVAAAIIFYFAGRAYYLYGMSSETHRDKMPNHLLQWEAMKQARRRGCLLYDLWGAPDTFHENDSMWGVFRFKEGLGGEVVRTLGAWDYPVKPLLYNLYSHIAPRILDIMRARVKQRSIHGPVD